MNETQIQEFLQQFQAAKDEVASWPNWMQDATKVATAAFPKTDKG